MKRNLYVIFDRVAGEAGPVFESKNDEVALRQFARLVKTESVICVDDYELLRIGMLDSETCVLEAQDASVVNVDEVLGRIQVTISENAKVERGKEKNNGK